MPDTKPPREQIIDTLKALPGVKVTDDRNCSCKIFEASNVQVDCFEYGSILIFKFKKDASLAEAVAALTPATCSPVPQDAIDELVAAAEAVTRYDYDSDEFWGTTLTHCNCDGFESFGECAHVKLKAAIARVKGGA